MRHWGGRHWGGRQIAPVPNFSPNMRKILEIIIQNSSVDDRNVATIFELERF
jgi:hypothetical protein